MGGWRTGVLAFLFVMGCSSPPASDSASGGSSGAGALGGAGGVAGAAGGGGAAGKECPCTSESCTCVPVADSDWIPVVLEDGLDATCPAEFPVKKQAGTMVSSPCSCTCGQPSAGSTCNVQLRQWSAPATDCGGGGSTASVYPAGFCYSGASAAAFSWFEVFPSGNTKCSPSVMKETPLFLDGVTICQATVTPTACEAGYCVADPPGFKHCVMHTKADATALCPVGYTEFKEYFVELDDQSSCVKTGCGCGAPVGVVCSASAYKCAYGTSCTGSCTPLPEKTCVANADFSIQLPSSSIVMDAGACEPTGVPTVVGSVALKDKRIVCCAP